MNHLGSWRWLAFCSLLCGTAHAGEPLLVVVEQAPDASVTPDEVRTAVAAEAQETVVAALDTSVDANSGALIVAIAAHRAVLTFRPRQGNARRRQIDLPAGHNDQLKTIGWIALNLVRNQLEGLVAEEQTKKGSTATAIPPDSQAERPLSLPLEPPPAPSPPVAYPTTLPAPLPNMAEESTKPSSPWSISLVAGPRMYPYDYNWTWVHWHDGNEWQMEAQRDYEGWTLGAALDMGPNDRPAAGLAGFVGSGWQWRRIRLEGTAGLGLELAQRRTRDDVATESSVNGPSSTTTISWALRPVLYGRANTSLLWQVHRSVSLMLRLALHLESESIVYCYGAALLGLRIQLP
jgi:hypothetical protein